MKSTKSTHTQEIHALFLLIRRKKGVVVVSVYCTSTYTHTLIYYEEKGAELKVFFCVVSLALIFWYMYVKFELPSLDSSKLVHGWRRISFQLSSVCFLLAIVFFVAICAMYVYRDGLLFLFLCV
jgi:hypothetical protein